MQFRVVIPDHVKSGQTIRIHCPDGTEANVKVPKGLKPGDSFIFEMSVDQLTNPQALLDSLQKDAKKKSANISFLDREIVNFQDFCLALCVGLIIGLGIVFGFILGILHVTQGIEVIEDGRNINLSLKKQQEQQQPLLVDLQTRGSETSESMYEQMTSKMKKTVDLQDELN